MAKLKSGKTLPDFKYETPFANNLVFSETVSNHSRTALVFLRYFGCTLCQLDLHQFARDYDSLTAAGGQLLVVLQSDPQTIAGQMKPGDLPYDIICDPGQELYHQFDIAPAASKAKLADLRTMSKMARALAGGYRHGQYEGDELQLPAVFIVDRAMELKYVHYGTSAGDIPGIQEMTRLLNQ